MINKNSELPCSISEAYFFLAMFYEQMFYINFDSTYLENTLNYYINALKFQPKIKNPNLMQLLQSYNYKEHAAYFCFRYAIHSNIAQTDYNRKELLNKSVDIYNDLLSTCNPDKFSTIYYRNLKDLAKCFLFLGEYENAYKNFKKFIYKDDKNLDKYLKGCYVFATLDLIQEDIDMLLHRYNRLLESYNSEADIENLCEVKFELLICYVELSIHQNSKYYYNEGKKILEELKNKYYGNYNTKRDKFIDQIEEMYK